MDEQAKEKADKDAQRVHQLEKQVHDMQEGHRREHDRLDQELGMRMQRIDELMVQNAMLETEEKKAVKTAAGLLVIVNDLMSGWGEDE